MKALVKTERKYGATLLQEVSKPQVAPGYVLIKIKATAVCGSDLHAYEYIPGYEFIDVPVILGHEYSGIVEAVGEGVRKFKVGDRVMGESNQYCGYCPSCISGLTNICKNNRMTGLKIDGGMAEYISIPERIVHKLPDNVSFAEAAAAQPCSVSFHGLFDKSTVKPADTVIVFGPGIIGLMAAQGAKILGASRIFVVGTNADAQSRLTLATQMGFVTINCEQENIKEVLKRELGVPEVDVAVECSGAVPAMQSCIDVVRKGGSITILGVFSEPMEIFFSPLIRNEILLSTSYTSTYDNYEQALKLISCGQVSMKPLIKEYAFQDYLQAFHDAIDKKVLKPVLILD